MILFACIILILGGAGCALLLGRQIFLLRSGKIAPRVIMQDDTLDDAELTELTAADMANMLRTAVLDTKRFFVMFGLKLSIKATNFAKRKTDAIVVYVHQKARERIKKERSGISAPKAEPNKFLEHIKKTTGERE